VVVACVVSVHWTLNFFLSVHTSEEERGCITFVDMRVKYETGGRESISKERHRYAVDSTTPVASESSLFVSASVFPGDGSLFEIGRVAARPRDGARLVANHLVEHMDPWLS